MRIRFTLDIDRTRPPSPPTGVPVEVDMGSSHVETSYDEQIGFRANVPDLERGW